MYRKMTEQHIALTGHKGQSRFFHIVKHIDEYPKIKIRRGKRQISVARNTRNDGATENSANNRKDPRVFPEIPFSREIAVFMYAINRNQTVRHNDRQSKKQLVWGILIKKQPAKNAYTCA